ncbi:MAG: glycosyltransferase, partial [Ktedonobacteraceae bacterium]|nr:glycosyltransferase [Ktedonobacteraceae bacterium]
MAMPFVREESGVQLRQQKASSLEKQEAHEQSRVEEERVGCSIGIMAYNEEANIARTVRALLEQRISTASIEEIIVVASGCTDRTVPIVAEIARQDARVKVCVQEKREGKASAVNLFLKEASSPIAILIGADVIPESSAIEVLCAPFKDPAVGMVGGRPIPVNDRTTFMGHAVHLLWRLHDRVARQTPKLGEVIAFRNVISGIPATSAVDEISIQALISQLGYRLLYKPECVVYNKGPVTVRDFLKQRRRIYAGHLKVRSQQNY